MAKEDRVHYLNFLTRTYKEVTQVIASTKQRLQSLPGEERDQEFDTLLKGQDKAEGLETVKGRISREIEKELKQWDIWEAWAKKIPGIGPYIVAELIMLFYYRFIPVCKDCGGALLKEEITKKDDEESEKKKKRTLLCQSCGKRAEKDGLLKHRLEYKDFSTISKWWAYMGRHTIEGVMPKRKKGVLLNWSPIGRTVGFHIGDQFNRQKDDHPYRALLLARKVKHQKNHPEWSKGHVHNAAKNEVVKIFLAHWWTVARTLEGKSVSEPYSAALLGHSNTIKPFYWEMDSDFSIETHSQDASQKKRETHQPAASSPNFEARI